MKPHPELKQPNVNVPNVLRTIELLERTPDEQFSMATFCGTAQCIGGHIIWGLIGSNAAPWEIEFTKVAGEFLGLDSDRARSLFLSNYTPCQIAHKHLTREKAIAVLKHLARTGEVDWSVAAPQKETP